MTRLGAGLATLGTAGLMLACGPAAALDPSKPVTSAWSGAGLSIESLTETRRRPLFSPGRRPPSSPVVQEEAAEAPPEAPATAPPPPPPPPDLRLVGIVGVGLRMIAVFDDPATGRLQRRQSGEIVLGWTLSVTSPKSVVFERGEERVLQTLFKR